MTQENQNSNDRKSGGPHRGGGHANAHGKPRPHSNGNKRNQRNNSSRNHRGGGGHGRRPLSKKHNQEKPITPLADDAVRFIPFGGAEEVGKNMYMFENKDDIFVMDIGFQFSEEETPGIDYIIPNVQYLEERKDKIRGVFISHGHLDHIGGIPFIMEKLGNPPIYCRMLTRLMIEKRQEEFPGKPKLNFVEVEPGQRITVGNTAVKIFNVTHSIPDSMGISIETPHGNVVVTGDLKLDHVNGVPTDAEQAVWDELERDNNLFFVADSTNAENPGWSVPESRIYDTIGEIIRNTPGRLIIGTFASQFARLVKIIEMCEENGKKVAAEGRSIKSNIEIAQRCGMLKPHKGTMITPQEIANYPADRIVVLATGAQGEEFAALSRMARDEHRFVTLNERDTILLSSSVIPGNELSVQTLKDGLYRHKIKLIHYRTSDVHASGHANQEELAWINQKVGAKYFMPAYGYHSMLRVHAEVAERTGRAKDSIIVPDNGTVIDIEGGEKLNRHPEKIPAWDIFVDGNSVSDTQDIVIRDRLMLSQDGMFVVIVMINPKTRKVKKSPDVISRGFIYLKENQELLKQTRGITRKTVEEKARKMQTVNFDTLKRDVAEQVSRFLLQKSGKRPMVIPVILSSEK